MSPKEIGSDSDAITHLENCPGCPECDALLEFYETCERCGEWGHKDVFSKRIKNGRCKAYCDNCLGKDNVL